VVKRQSGGQQPAGFEVADAQRAGEFFFGEVFAGQPEMHSLPGLLHRLTWSGCRERVHTRSPVQLSDLLQQTRLGRTDLTTIGEHALDQVVVRDPGQG
jgi:hypothetical protein